MPQLAPDDAACCRAALELSRSLGALATDASVLVRSSNVFVRIRPDEIVAKIGAKRPPEHTLVAFDREVRVARYLADAGRPVVAPSRSVDPGPHTQRDFVVSFWERAMAPGEVSVRAAAKALRECHDALHEGHSVGDGPDRWRELSDLLTAVPCDRLARTERELLLRAVAQFQRVLEERADTPWHGLHGDAHLGNVVRTSGRIVWSDWEETFEGPAAWDLATLVAGPLVMTRNTVCVDEALDGYGEHFDRSYLLSLITLRTAQHEIWSTHARHDHPASGARRAARRRWLVEHLDSMSAGPWRASKP